MVANSSEMYDQKNWVKFGRKAMAGGGPPPAHYRDVRCLNFCST